MGKGRTIAGLVLENWRCGRRRALWLTIGTDLRVDSRRDLDDVGAAHVPLHPLNKLPYGALDSDKARSPCSQEQAALVADGRIGLLVSWLIGLYNKTCWAQVGLVGQCLVLQDVSVLV